MFQNFHVVFYVTYRNVPDRHVQINGTLTVSYVTLREGGKQTLGCDAHRAILISAHLLLAELQQLM